MRLFSIITICRNNLPELKLTFQSIQSQKVKNFEWIVIDGDSNDGTKDWISNNPLIDKWISESDKGIYDAMNKGILLAEGEYLVFMNSGDEFADERTLGNVEKAINRKKDHPVFIYGDSVDLDESGNQYYRKAKHHKYIQYGMITQHQAMFFNTMRHSPLKFPEQYLLSADYALISEVLKNNPDESLLQLNFPICKFRMGGANEIQRLKAIREDYDIRKKFLKLSNSKATLLYMLHLGHAVIKHTFKKSRFLKHQKINTFADTKS